jgi:nucleotide-binding universal stress UspA family protein
LAQISKRFPKGARIERHVHIGGISDVSLSLSAHSLELEQQLIIMCVHGRGGILRLVSGNLAERIMREQTVPVLLVRTGGGASNSGGIGTVLAALDGKPDHDQGFPMAVEIASKMAARLVLATVVPTWITLMGEKGAAGRLLPGATAELLSQTDASARSYLKARAEVASSAGIPAEIVVGRGNPARMIARMARGKSADLIVLGTHGRAGTRAFWAGSTAYRIIESTRAPILLVPAREDRR